MNTEHTPGPWSTSSAFGVISNDEVICRVRRIRKGQGDANARLIAAAPDLLEALKVMLFAFEELAKVIKPLSSDPVIVSARAAVCKAEGITQNQQP